jgi:hypothetical protein
LTASRDSIDGHSTLSNNVLVNKNVKLVDTKKRSFLFQKA